MLPSYHGKNHDRQEQLGTRALTKHLIQQLRNVHIKCNTVLMYLLKSCPNKPHPRQLSERQDKNET